MSKPSSITVTGTGSASAVPDVMNISFTVQAHHPQAATAFARASDTAREVIAAIGTAAPEAVLSTTGITLADRSTWRNDESVLLGYDAATTLEAVGLAMDAVAMVLGAAVAAGGDALRIHSLRSEVSDPDPALLEARDAAFADARAKASQLARLAGARLGPAQQMREVADAPAFPLQRAKASPMAASSMPVAAGRQDLSVHLEVVWLLLDGDPGPLPVS